MASDWNAGTLKTIANIKTKVPDGIKIFKKIPNFLKLFYSRNAKRSLRSLQLQCIPKDSLNFEITGVDQKKFQSFRATGLKENAFPKNDDEIQNIVHVLEAKGLKRKIQPSLTYPPSLKQKLTSPMKRVRKCNNCGRDRCKGGSGAGHKGLKCDRRCECGIEGCFGGKILHCLGKKRFKNDTCVSVAPEDLSNLNHLDHPDRKSPLVCELVDLDGLGPVVHEKSDFISHWLKKNEVKIGESDILTRNGVPFGINDLKRMQGCNWINDNVIDSYGQLLMLLHSDCFVFSTHFYSSLYSQGNYNYKKVARWTRRIVSSKN